MQVLWIFALIGAACAYHDNHVRMPQAHSPLETEYEWKYFDYEWESPGQKEAYIHAGRYYPKNMVPIDVDRAMDGRTFVTVIRKAGVPASLHTVSDKKGESGPLLRPYPDWSWYSESKGCEGIISVYRVAIDKCNRLWVLDTGRIDEKFVCPAKLIAFDLLTDNVVFSKSIPDNVARNSFGEGLLVTPIVNTEDCVHTAVYMADMTGYGMVVWNGTIFFRLPEDASFFGPGESSASFDIAGVLFDLPDGLLGMALSPDNSWLFFKPLASRSLYIVDTNELKDEESYYLTVTMGEEVFSSQASTMAISKDKILFYGLTHEIAIGCWNMHSSISSSKFKIAVQDKERLQFASGMKVINNNSNPYEEQLLVMTNRFQKIVTNTLDLDEVNFRVLKANVEDLVRGAGCDKIENENINNKVHRVLKLG